MAHLVESMAYVGETPWHGLGNRLTPKQPLEVWAKQAGMDWQIQEAPVCFLTGKAGQLRGIQSFDDHKVLYRSDTHAPLSVVSNRYKVVQPRQVLEFYRDLTECSGFQLETAGVLKGGKKVWALARTGQSALLPGNDENRGYVLLATACDGTLATTAQFTCIRVVCNNTLSIAVNGATGAVKVPHAITLETKVFIFIAIFSKSPDMPPIKVTNRRGRQTSHWHGIEPLTLRPPLSKGTAPPSRPMVRQGSPSCSPRDDLARSMHCPRP